MKKKIHFLFCIAVCTVLSSVAFGQDTHFSQFDFSPLHQNAANTGKFKGDYRFTAIYRNQYKSVTVPYKTIGASLDANIGLNNDKRGYWSAGLVVEQDKTGDGNYGTLDLDFSVAYNYFLDDDKNHLITIGLQPGLMQHKLDFDNFYFGNQYDSTFYDPNLPNNETLDRSKNSLFNINTGLYYTFKFAEGSDVNAGMGLHHLNKPNLSFYGDREPLAMRLTGEFIANLKLTEQIYLHPQVLYYSQNKFQQINAGANVSLRTSKSEFKSYRFSLGAFYRVKDAVIGRVGVGYNNWDLGFAYDVNTSDLKRASNNRGAYEIALKYIITKVKPVKKSPPCPVY